MNNFKSNASGAAFHNPDKQADYRQEPHEAGVKSKRKRSKSLRSFQGAELSGLVRRLSRNGNAAVGELEKLKETVQAINQSKSAISADKRAGFIFEEWHASTYNAAARKAGDRITTANTGSNGGFVNDPRVDIVVSRGKTTIAEVQAKCCSSPGRTAVSVAKPKYAGTDRLVPSDQAKVVKEALSKSAAKKATSSNPTIQAKGAIRGEAAKKVTDRIKAKGHSSKPITHKGTQELAKGDLRSLDRMIRQDKFVTAAKGGATAGGMFGGAVSAVSNLTDAVKGRKSAKDAAIDVAKDTASGAAKGAVNALVTEGVKEAGKRLLGKEVAKTFIKGSAPAAIAGCAYDMVEDAVKGTLTVEKAAKNMGRASSAWAGAEGGAVLGAMVGGPPGALIGCILGGVAASFGFGAIFG